MANPGLVQIVDGFPFTGDVVYPDALINKGTIAILDPTHRVFPAPAGNLLTLPNIAKGYVEDLVGAGSGDDWVPTTYRSFDPTNKERTTKGGLHLALKNTGFGAFSNPGFGYQAPAATSAYEDAHRDHVIYSSVIGVVTRVRTGSAEGSGSIVGFSDLPQYNTGTGRSAIHSNLVAGTPAVANFRIYGGNGSITGSTAGTTNGNSIPMVPGSFLMSIAARDATSGASVLRAFMLSMGDTNVRGTAIVFYRFTREDLTVSGLTWAERDALDLQWRADNIDAADGYLHGDTWTAPNTLAG